LGVYRCNDLYIHPNFIGLIGVLLVLTSVVCIYKYIREKLKNAWGKVEYDIQVLICIYTGF